MLIKFGTDGWRGIISDEFTFYNVRLIARAIACYLKSPERKELSIYHLPQSNTTYHCHFRPYTQGVIVGYDTRFLSREYACEVAKVLSANGIPVYLSQKPAPTPAISYAVKEKQAAGAVMITASHNPYIWNGIKLKVEFAGSAPPEVTSKLEEYISEEQKKEDVLEKSVVKASIKEFDPRKGYLQAIRNLVDVDIISLQNFRIVSDPLYGTNIGYLKALLPQVDVIEINAEINPSFGGISPEPIPCNLNKLFQVMKEENRTIGFAFDGDGDRIAVIDGKEGYLSSHDIFTLLLWYLYNNRHWEGGVIKTFSTTQRIKLLAQRFGLPFYETPIGFKHICHLMLTEDILIGGEESGGIGMKNHIPERDSLLNALMLLEMMALYKMSIGEILRMIHDQIGAFCYQRMDLSLDGYFSSFSSIKDFLLTTLNKISPDRLCGLKVVERQTLDGLKLLLEDGSWILFRASGTEPLIRIYAEASTREATESLLESGKNILKSIIEEGRYIRR